MKNKTIILISLISSIIGLYLSIHTMFIIGIIVNTVCLLMSTIIMAINIEKQL